MVVNMTRFAQRSLLFAAMAFTFLCLDLVVAQACEHSRNDKLLEKSNCTGYQVAVHSVWTEIQCLDSCFRHPYCAKYIFYGQGNQNCRLLHIGDMDDVPGVVDLPKISGKCAPSNITDLREFLLGTKDCPELKDNDISDNEIRPSISPRYVNGGK